jgi:pilus assembly protein Flp/PilA
MDGARTQSWGEVNFPMFLKLLAALQSRLAEVQAEDGQTMVEYALILALISVVAIAILTTVGSDIVSVFSSVAAKL